MSDIVVIASAILGSSGLWALILAVWQGRKSRMTAERRALLGLLYAELTNRCRYYLDSGEISDGEYRDLDKYIYQPYKSLGGDGIAEQLMDQVQPLIKV